MDELITTTMSHFYNDYILVAFGGAFFAFAITNHPIYALSALILGILIFVILHCMQYISFRSEGGKWGLCSISAGGTCRQDGVEVGSVPEGKGDQYNRFEMDVVERKPKERSEESVWEIKYKSSLYIDKWNEVFEIGTGETRKNDSFHGWVLKS